MATHSSILAWRIPWMEEPGGLQSTGSQRGGHDLSLSLPAEPQEKPKNTEVGSLSLLQGIFSTQGSNPGLSNCRWTLYQLSQKGSPRIMEWVAYPFSSRSSRPRNRIKVLHCRQILYQLRDQESPSQSSQVDNSYPLPHPHKRAKSPNSNFP